MVLLIFSFLCFGPITVPVFSELGNKILNREEILEENEKPEVETEEVEEPEKEQILQTEEIEEAEEKSGEVVEKNFVTTTKPIVEPVVEEPVGPDCSEETILEYAKGYCKANYFLTRTIGINIDIPSLSSPLLKPKVDELEYQKGKLMECNIDAKTYIRNWSHGVDVCIDALYFRSTIYNSGINREGLF